MYDSIFLLEDNENRLLALGEESYVNGDLKTCSAFIEEHLGEYIFGFLSYDLKNQIEDLSSQKRETVHFPELYFVVPKFVIEISDSQIKFLKGESNDEVEEVIEKMSREVFKSENNSIHLKPSTPKDVYLEKVSKLQKHIQYGDIYEVTFCQEFYAKNVEIDPFEVYNNLSQLTLAPFRCFVKHDNSYLLSGSPERFIRKEGKRISSQPIKGTARRNSDVEQDQLNKENLINSAKEKAENVMIVDLVRNDLSKIAKRNSVKVDELFGVYSFRTVHQLISTISAVLKDELDFATIIEALFPMGSMTGAPKISAMKLIEEHEDFRRGLFSGSVGYIKPSGDFDFNVVIRSILYNDIKKYISCPVGGAITIQSDPEEEYEECLVKVDALKRALAK